MVSRIRSHTCVRRLIISILAPLLIFPNCAKGDSDREIRIFTAAVYYVTKFAHWQWDSSQSQFLLCAFGDQSETSALQNLLASKQLDGHEIKVISLKSPSELRTLQCNLLYLGIGTPSDITKKLNITELVEHGMLVIGRDQACPPGSCVVLLAEDENRLKIVVNRDLLDRSSVKFASELLSIAEIH